MWSLRTELHRDDHWERNELLHRGRAMPYRQVMTGWRDDGPFRSWFIERLAAPAPGAYVFETPPVTRATLERPFEFVLRESPALARAHPDASSFAEHFDAADAKATVVGFWNLGRDAYLVAPLPLAAPAAYPHLAAFARRAPQTQQHAWLRAAADALGQQISDRPLWLSTSGLGVPWLHLRLDVRPKYYTHAPYRSAPSQRRA
jgi:hypothetical protein